MSSGGLDLVLGGPALSALCLPLAFSESNSSDFGDIGDAHPDRRRPFIFDVNETYVTNSTKVEGKYSIVLFKLFFFSDVEELYWVFSTYA